MTYTVTVIDEETGVSLSLTGIDPANAGTNADEHRDALTGEPLTGAQRALLIAAPEVCPFDCDHCRAD